MNIQGPHGESERKEGLGGRVRRFVDTELSRVLDKDNPSADQHQRQPDRATGSGHAHEADRVHEPVQAAHQEPVAAYPGVSGRADPAMTTAPADSGYDPPRHERAGDTGALSGRSSDQTAADAGAERVGLLDDPASLREQWQQLQGTFVDDPQRAVREAGELIERTLQEIRANVTRGQAGDPTSTEDLRMSFQRYREFFQRLLSA